MENAAKKPEIIPVGAGNGEVQAFLVINSFSETVIRIVAAVSARKKPEVMAAIIKVRDQEMLCLRKVGYEQVESRFHFTETNGKYSVAEERRFAWTDWKWGVMKTARP